jgi:hypothetical protein
MFLSALRLLLEGFVRRQVADQIASGSKAVEIEDDEYQCHCRLMLLLV